MKDNRDLEYLKKYKEEYRKPVFFDKECATKDINNNHCQEDPIHTIIIDGRSLLLCEKCFFKWNQYR